MKKIKNFVIGGLQQKIFNLVLLTIVLVVIVYSSVIVFQFGKLREIVGKTGDMQQESLTRISSQGMEEMLGRTLQTSTTVDATLADQGFREVKTQVEVLGDFASMILNSPELFHPGTVSGPDLSLEGTVSTKLMTAQGVDLEDEEISAQVSLLANMSPLLESLYKNANVNTCFIATPEGVLLVADERSEEKIDENGNPKHIPITERPWYIGAKETGDVYFTDIEKDSFSDNIGIVCALPVYHDGELAAVVGADLFLDGMAQAVGNSGNDQEGFVCIINQEGHVLFAPKDQTIFSVEEFQDAQDLRESEDEEFADFLKKALVGSTEITLMDVGGTSCYLAGAPLQTVGWVLLTVVPEATLNAPTRLMQEQYNQINEEARGAFYREINNSMGMIIILIIGVCVLALGGSLLLANRIVKPLNIMTTRIQEVDEENPQFYMDAAYKTGDEIQLVAEAFAGLSAKSVQYLREITRVTAEKERISVELNLATQIQADILPRVFPAFPGRPELDIYASMDPAKEVGGDFYDYFLVDEDHLALVMADVSGKGVPAALFMMVAKTLIKNRMITGDSPGQALENVNDQLLEGNAAGLFVTVWLGLLEISTGKGIAANAGHEHPVIRRADGEYELVVYRHSPAVGVIESIPFKEHRFQMNPGDSLFVYTDGVPEATNLDNELFGNDRMLEALNIDPEADSENVLRNVTDRIGAFVDGAEQFDDITMLCLKYYGPHKEVAEDMNEQQKIDMLNIMRDPSVKSLEIEALTQNLPEVLSFVDEELEAGDCSMKTQMQIDIAVEELFTNICLYAYAPDTGMATIKTTCIEPSHVVIISFEDEGKPFNPVERENPDVTLSAEEREIGGLGIFMVKKTMLDMQYEYRDGKNILAICKEI